MRRTLSALKDRLKRTTSSTYLKIALAAVLFIPLMYGALYLKAFWDPYANMADLPVAVVNQDSGYKNGSISDNVGQDLVKELKSNNQAGWEFVDAKTAEKGLNSKKYYAEIIIPSDFSQDVYSVDTSNPTKAELTYRSRVANNFLADTILSNVAKQVSESLSHKLSAKYIANIFSSLRSTSGSLQTAASASNTLATGLGTISAGSASINTGINSALSGSNQLVAGLNTLKTNQDTLTSGLNSAVSGTDSLISGAQQVKAGLDSTSSQLLQASSDLKTTSGTISGTELYTKAAEAAIDDCIKSSGVCSTTDMQTIKGTLSKLNDEKTGLPALSAALSSSSDALKTSVNDDKQGILAMQNGQKSIINGLTVLSSSLQTAASGSAQLSLGTTQLVSGTTSLNSGLSTLSTGSSTLTTGINSASSGANQLSTSLSNGASAIKSATDSNKTSKQTTVMSSPVKVKSNSYDIVPNYGSGFAPYFISLSLWVGGIMAFFVVDFKKKTVGRRAAVAKYFTLGLIGTVQAVLLGIVLKDMLGLRVVNVAAYYGFIVLTSWSFMAFLQLLIQHLDDAGRYIAVILLILQLAACAGTFPIELIPKFFQVINPLMPMTYTVQGLRAILYTHALSQAIAPALVMLGILVVSMALNLFITKRKKTLYYRHEQTN